MRACRCIVFAVLLAASLNACGGSKGRGGGDNVASVSGEIFVEGGQASYAVILIETKEGRVYMVQSSPLGDELRSLVGMRVAVRGPVVGEMEGVPIIVLNWYELLPLSSGERPVVGWVREGGYIVTESDVVWKLEGDFGDLLATFMGSKIWVVGIVMQNVNTSQGSYRVLDVTDYGVIRQ